MRLFIIALQGPAGGGFSNCFSFAQRQGEEEASSFRKKDLLPGPSARPGAQCRGQVLEVAYTRGWYPLLGWADFCNRLRHQNPGMVTCGSRGKAEGVCPPPSPPSTRRTPEMEATRINFRLDVVWHHPP